MKKKKVFVLLIPLVIIISMFAFALPKHKSPVYCKYADSITDSYLRYLKKEHQIKCVGAGGGFLSNVEEIFLALSSIENNVNVDRARVHYINFTEELLMRVNKDEKIRPYLSHYPFSEKGISLTLSFIVSEEEPQKGYVSYMTFVNGKIIYAHDDPDSKKLEVFYEEPYEEALRIVREAGRLSLSGVQ